MSAKAISILRRLLAVARVAERDETCAAFEHSLDGPPLAEWQRIRREATALVAEEDRRVKAAPN